MFCPEGYVSLYETIQKIPEFADTWWQRQSAEYQEHSINETRKAFKKSYDNGKMPGITIYDINEISIQGPPYVAYSFWGSIRFVRNCQNRFFAVSPNGLVLRIGDSAVATSRDFSGAFPMDHADQVEIVGEFSDGFFWHLEEDFYTISPCKDEETIELFGLERIVNILNNFEGWSICWKPKVFENWVNEARSIIEQEQTQRRINQDDFSDRRQGRGQPKKGDGLIEIAMQREFSRRLQSGKLLLDQRESIWAEAQDWADEIFGKRFSRSTVQRYLAPIVPQRNAHK